MHEASDSWEFMMANKKQLITVLSDDATFCEYVSWSKLLVPEFGKLAKKLIPFFSSVCADNNHRHDQWHGPNPNNRLHPYAENPLGLEALCNRALEIPSMV